MTACSRPARLIGPCGARRPVGQYRGERPSAAGSAPSMPELLAVIPARGGSKRLPGKNVRLLAGRPALEDTITPAPESALFARIVVSTDSAAIAEMAERAGAEVPFLRDPYLADDATPVSAVTADALRRLDPRGDTFGAVAQLMPNCPLRTADDVEASARQFVATGAASQLSVTRFGWQNPWWAMRRAATLPLERLFVDAVTRPSQELPALFCPTGAVWWAQAAVLRQTGTFHIPERTGWAIPWYRAVDVDTEEDWRLV